MAYNSSQFSNANGVTFGTQAGLSGNIVTASVAAVAGAQTGISGLSAGTTQLTSGTAVFSNSNNVSFGVNGNTVTASASFNQTTASSAFFGTGNTTYSSSGSLNGASFVLRGDGLVSVGISNDSVLISGPASTLFQYTSNTSNITSNALNTSSPRINLSAGTTSNNMSAVTFSNSNGVSFGLNGSVVTASHNGITSQSVQTQNMVSINGSTGNISFSNANGLTFGANASTITASYTVPTITNSSATISAGTTSGTLSNLVFSNSNGVSFGLNNGTITASYNSTQFQSTGNYLTTAAQSNQVVNSLNGSTGQISLNVGSSLSASTNGSSITFGLASNITTALQSTGNYLTTARASTDAVGLNTAQSNVTWTVNSSGLSFDARGYVGTATAFSGTNVSATMTHNSAGFSLQLSAPNAGAGGGVAVANSQTTYTSGTVNLVEGGGAITIASTTGQSYKFSVPATSSLVGVGQITISTNGSTISISGATVGNPIFSAGTTSNNLGSIVFSNSNGVSFGLNGSTITASVGAGAGAALKGSGTYTQNSGTIEFANSNGITFGLSNNGTMTASHNGITQQSTQPVALSGSNGSFNFSTATFGNLNGVSFYTSNGSMVASYTVPTLTNSSLTMQAGASTLSSVSRIAFVDSNGVSFGASTSNNGSITITATVKTDYLTTARASNDAIGLNTAQTNVTWTVNSSGLSLNAGGYAGTGFTTASTVGTDIVGTQATNGISMGIPKYLTTAMQSNATTISNINISAGTTSTNASAFTFSNSNGMTFGLGTGANVGVITGSYTVPSTAGLISAVNLSAGTTSNNLTAFTLSNSNNVSFGLNGSVVTGSASFAQSVQPVAISGSNGSFNFSTVTFGASNGISFYTTNNSMVASYTVPTVTNSSFSVQDSATTINPVARIAFSTGNNITLSLSTGASSATVGVAHNLAGTSTGFGGNLISASMTHNSSGLNLSLNHPAWITTAMQSNAATISNVNISAGTTSTNASAFTFNNANGITFGLGTGASAGSITASHNGLTTARASTDAVGLNTAQSNVTWTVNSSGLSLDARGYAGTASTFNGTNVSGSITLNSNGLRLDLSAANAAAGNVTFSAGTTSSGLAAVTFSNANGVSFGLGTGANAGVITASANAGGGGVAIAASNTTFTSGTVQFNGSGALTVGSGAQAVNLSVPATSSLAAGGAITLSSNASTITISAPNKSSFVGVNGITVSTAGSTISISGTTTYLPRLVYPDHQIQPVSVPGNGTASIQYVFNPAYITGTRLDALFSWSAGSTTTSNTMGIALSAWAAIYTLNGASLSSLSSGSTQTTYTYASNSAGWSSVGLGMRPISVPMNFAMTPGEYYVMFNMSTTNTSIGAATTSLGQTWSIYGGSQLQSEANYNDIGANTATSTGLFPGMGLYTAALGSVPPNIALSNIAMTGTNLSRANIALVFRNY